MYYRYVAPTELNLLGYLGRRADARRYKCIEPTALIGSVTSKASERRFICNSWHKRVIPQKPQRGDMYVALGVSPEKRITPTKPSSVGAIH